MKPVAWMVTCEVHQGLGGEWRAAEWVYPSQTGARLSADLARKDPRHHRFISDPIPLVRPDELEQLQALVDEYGKDLKWGQTAPRDQDCYSCGFYKRAQRVMAAVAGLRAEGRTSC